MRPASASERAELTRRAEYLFKLVFSAGLVLVGGLMSGLTLGLMGLDLVNLRGEWEAVRAGLSSRRQSSPRPAPKQSRRTLLRSSACSRQGTLATESMNADPVLSRHWILVTLLLSNVVVNESLRASLVLDASS